MAEISFVIRWIMNFWEKSNVKSVNIALRRFLHNYGNIAAEGSPLPLLNDLKGAL